MKNGLYLVGRAQKFSAHGTGRFAKEIVRVGKWVHPVTGKDVVFDQARVDKLAEATELYLSRGNTIPFPKGHTTDPLANLGHWPGPFISHEGALVGVVEPKEASALEGIRNGTLDHVSAYIEPGVKDSQGNSYDEVITHVCATNYPVITGQADFVALSREAFEKTQTGIYLPESLAADGSCDPMHLQDVHDQLKGEVDRHAKAYAKSVADKGLEHKDTKEAAGKLRDATTRHANHAELMRKHVHNMTNEYAYPMSRTPLSIEPVELGEVLREFAGDGDALALALRELAQPEGTCKTCGKNAQDKGA